MSTNTPKRLFTFQSTDRLKSRKLIQEAFNKKQTVSDFPIKLFYLQVEGGDISSNSQFAVIVSKKLFPLAVDRMKIKRLMRESIRHIKPGVDERLIQVGKKYVFLSMYQSNTIISYNEMFLHIEKAIQKLWNKI